tara:strand:+ start:2580 stop:3032 length:453 start_codon:yes stop_codon:yes gene_type:complete
MRVVIQRVTSASVSIKSKIKCQIKTGLLIFLGIEKEDIANDVIWLCKKISSLRIFSDDYGKMNLSVKDINGDVMIISQFTLHAKTKKGNRPSYIKAASPEKAIFLYKMFKSELSSNLQKKVFSGKFGSDMQVKLTNDGPVTIIIDTKNKE